MLTDPDIAKFALEVARRELGPSEVESVSAEAVVDSWGDDAIGVTIVVSEGALDRVSDDAVLDTLVGIWRTLESHGEERQPIVSYATRKELSFVDDP